MIQDTAKNVGAWPFKWEDILRGASPFVPKTPPDSQSRARNPSSSVFETTYQGTAAVGPGTDSLPIRLKMLFAAARGYPFDSGMHNLFSQELVSLIEEHGSAAVRIIGLLLAEGQVDPFVAAETLEWLGRIEDPTTQMSRLRVLEENLQSSSPHIRDGAVSGLSFLEDPAAIPAIRQAIRQETRSSLRSYMEEVLAQLGDTQKWPSF